jgi:DNA-binding XRE family transcriptional regulator
MPSASKKEIATHEKISERARTFRALAAIGCTKKDIAGNYGVSRKTIYDWMHEYPELKIAYNTGVGDFRISLRSAQFKAAVEKGNVAMLIHLGRVALGQSYEKDKDGKGKEHNITLKFETEETEKAADG